jgi:DNA invertase Pin-like site-specific DNA recombinase
MESDTNEVFTRSEDKAVRQLLVMILSWVSERVRSDIVSRTKAGLDGAKAEGKQLGRPRNHIDWEIVKIMRRDGISWTEIGELLLITPIYFLSGKKTGWVFRFIFGDIYTVQLM